MTKKMVLILGGVRSGKSRHALERARECGDAVLFVATAEAGDEEMKARIEAHRMERNKNWSTLEVKRHLGKAIGEYTGSIETVLIDCMSLLVSNVIMWLPESASETEVSQQLSDELDAMLSVYAKGSATWIIVSNETGLGVVPPYRSGRIFRDSLGRLNQQLAQHADEVVWMAAGIPVKIK